VSEKPSIGRGAGSIADPSSPVPMYMRFRRAWERLLGGLVPGDCAPIVVSETDREGSLEESFILVALGVEL
jgi:hypothetical protein